jgi:hypothetical protein
MRGHRVAFVDRQFAFAYSYVVTAHDLTQLGD